MFSEEKYYSGYKKIRNKIRIYNSYDLIGEALTYINAPYKSKYDYLRRNTWLVLLFVKWVLLDWKYPNINGKKASAKDVHSLLNAAYRQYSETQRLPTEYEHHSLFIRNIAFQQFPYQKDFSYVHISRQALLFTKLNDNHYIKETFRKNTGLEIQEYLDLSLTTLSRFIESEHIFLPTNWLSTLSKKYSNKTIRIFLSLISSDLHVIRENFIKTDNSKRLASENYELSPFIEYPLISLPGKLLLTHKTMLFRHFEHYIYDTLKKNDSEKFMNKFGELFERYIEKSLKYSKLNYLTEKQIQNALGKTGNQIDFIIQEDSANIFIDAKAVEMNSLGKTTHSSKILRDKTKTSIFKAIKQSHDVIRKIEEIKNPKITKKQNNYLLVITFKDLHLGNGSTYYEVIAKNKMDKIYSHYKNTTCIPPENMYFITIDDFDLLSEILKNKEFSLSQIIEKAKENDANLNTKKFDFSMHLNSLEISLKPPKFIEQEIEIILKRIESSF